MTNFWPLVVGEPHLSAANFHFRLPLTEIYLAFGLRPMASDQRSTTSV